MNRLVPTRREFSHVVFPAEERRFAVFDGAAPRCESFQAGEPAPFSAEEIEFLEWLFDEAGLNLRNYRWESLRRRLPACLRVLRVNSPAAGRRMIEENPRALRAALSAMLIGVSSFFRDPEVFAAIGQELAVLAGTRVGIGVWSAACSDGQELYSVAMMLAERNLLKGSHLLGTDCRADAIEKARAGFFSDPEIKNLPSGYRLRHLERAGAEWRILGNVREAIHWRRGDLLRDLEPGAWDLILLRNLSMYLRPEAAETVWARVEGALRAGGLLVLGKAERPGPTRRLVRVGPCLYRRGFKPNA